MASIYLERGTDSMVSSRRACCAIRNERLPPTWIAPLRSALLTGAFVHSYSNLRAYGSRPGVLRCEPLVSYPWKGLSRQGIRQYPV